MGMNAHGLNKSLAYPKTPMSVKCAEMKSLLLTHFRPLNFEAAEAAHFHNLLRKPDANIRGSILQLHARAKKV